MPELRVAAVISDMDGVLVDTGGIYDRHWAAWASRHGIDPERIVGLHHGRPAVLTISLVAPDMDPLAEARRFNEELAADGSASGVTALPGALALSAALPPDRWAICTSAPRVMAERWLEHIGIARPPVLVTVDDVARGKPAPDPYLRAAELLGRDPAACLVIEDAPAGITSAKAAGAVVLAVLTSYPAEALEAADAVIGGLDELGLAVVGDDLVVSWGLLPGG
jgi:sugar-phosphatase